MDILCLTRPEAVTEIHRQYLEAGADIIETNTFGSSPIGMEEFDLPAGTDAGDQSGRGGLCPPGGGRMHGSGPGAAAVRGRFDRSDGQNRLDVPACGGSGYRAVTFDQHVESYYQQVAALVEGGVDILFPETTFDTLNLKACLFAIARYFEERAVEVPVMASVTITDRAGRTLSGQTIEAFWNSIAHFPLLSVGINCALGPEQMRPYLAELSKIAPVYVSCHPNAGLPNEFGGFDLTPAADGGHAAGVRRPGLAEHRGRLLRHDTPVHRGNRADGPRPGSASPADRRTVHASERPGGVDVSSGRQLRDGRRADERHGLAPLRPLDSRREVRRSGGQLRASRWKPAPASST